jgi:glycosyltransferase involved in cell wall biosynthesis
MDIVCFSHLRWHFVYQRPQHLLSRFARNSKVFFIKEPVFDAETPHLEITTSKEGVHLLIPHLQTGLREEAVVAALQGLIRTYFCDAYTLKEYLAWFYTPIAIDISDALPPATFTVYDCMDELSAFLNAPASLRVKEASLMRRADLMFTGGHSLYEAKQHLHKHIYPFPSSIDNLHFGKARNVNSAPADQDLIPCPRIGFFGVINERFDIELMREAANRRPDWHFILIGPTVKIDPATLPAAENIHYLGGKTYDELPLYLGTWDVAMIPFALNESTKFISPTKTPEYLAGGVPVVSTPIRDVVRPYGEKGLVQIASNPAEFITGVEKSLEMRKDPGWLKRVDEYVGGLSWDITWQSMQQLIDQQMKNKAMNQSLNEAVYV